jgi:hypothetical protein
MGYFFCNCPPASSSGGGGIAGKYLSANLPAGSNVSFNPGSGWPSTYGRLDLVLAGDATLESLVAGNDGQEVTVRNNSAFTLTIPTGGGGSEPFAGGGGGTILPPGTAINLTYYAGSINEWVIVQ